MYLVRRNHYGHPHTMSRLAADACKHAEQDSVAWSPRMDIKEDTESYEIKADLPGFNKDDIHITLKENVLTLKGERKGEEKDQENNTYYTERLYGSFCRSFTLPAKVNESDIKAMYKDGVLQLTLPKAEEAKPKDIAIS